MKSNIYKIGNIIKHIAEKRGWSWQIVDIYDDGYKMKIRLKSLPENYMGRFYIGMIIQENCHEYYKLVKQSDTYLPRWF